jgi:predicted RNase H-like HicB family nuclease
MKYTVIIEKEDKSYGAYLPDIPGCVAVGETESEVISLLREALEMHIEALKEDHLEVPLPLSKSLLLEVN